MRNAKRIGRSLGWAFVLSLMVPICANAIVSAWYGNPASTATIGNGRVDVTSSLNKMIINGDLTLPAGADTYNSLFTDPAEGIAKILHIELADGTSREFQANTTATLKIPVVAAPAPVAPVVSSVVTTTVTTVPAPVVTPPVTTSAVAEVPAPAPVLTTSVPVVPTPEVAPIVAAPVTPTLVAAVPVPVLTPPASTTAAPASVEILPAIGTTPPPPPPAPTTVTVPVGEPVIPVQAPQVAQPAAQPPVVKLSNVPADFVLEGGTAQDIAVGSKNGELVAYALGLDGQMYMFQPNSLNAVPWVKQTAVDQNNNPIFGFKDLSMSSDGVLCAISDIGKAYVYYWQQKQFMEVPAGVGNEDLFFDKITVGNVNNVWAVNEASKNIYQLGPNGWELRAENAGVFVAAGYDGSVFGINDQGDVFKYNPAISGWTRYPGVKLSYLALGSNDFVYGTYKNGDVYELWQLVNNAWQRVLGADGQGAIGIDEIAVNAAGTIFAIDYAGNIYNKGNLGIAVTVPSPATIVSAPTSVGTLTSDPVAVNVATSKPVTKVSTATKARKDAKKTGKVATTVKKTAKVTKRTKTKAPAPKKSVAKTTAKTAKATASTTAKKATAAKAATPKAAVTATPAAATAATVAPATDATKVAATPAKAKTAAKKAAVKKTPGAKSAKKTAAKKPAAKKTPTTKAAPAKTAVKVATKKAPTAAKKPVVKKAAAATSTGAEEAVVE